MLDLEEGLTDHTSEVGVCPFFKKKIIFDFVYCSVKDAQQEK